VNARRRLAAVAALALAAATLTLTAATAIAAFPRGLIMAASAVLALLAGWYGVLRRGVARAAGLAVALGLILGAAYVLVSREPAMTLVVVVALWLALASARSAFRVRFALPAATAPVRPVLLYNPRSGGGKAARFDLPTEARERGIEPIELVPGADLEVLAQDAVAAGADGLAMAGGDGSQAVVAAVAAEHGLPYACIPAGTRNHFALDLGVARDDVVGALDAFVDGGERVVDLADVNGRVFVNNVSLGLYAAAVRRPGYRHAKLRTLLDTVPDVLGPEAGQPPGLRWADPDGDEHASAAAILVSNNRYRLGRAVGSGTRPRIDDGLLGITVVGVPHGWREWSTPEFEVRGDGRVPAGIDGEATELVPPLRFHIHPAALRVRIARTHPGASPSALQPDGMLDALRSLGQIAAGRDTRARPVTTPRSRVTHR
jgi:hypothetical protein